MTRNILSSIVIAAMLSVAVSNAAVAQLKSKQKGQATGSFSELQGITTHVNPIETKPGAGADGKYTNKKLPGRPR